VNGQTTGRFAHTIAELSANHRQHEDAAVQLVHAPTGRPTRSSPDVHTRHDHHRSDAASFRRFRLLWEGTTLHASTRGVHAGDWQPRLKALAESLGMHCFSSPFDPTAVDFLASIDVPAFKVASFELVDLPLIRRMAATGKPLVMSTGMGTEAEIDEAVAAARRPARPASRCSSARAISVAA
jgi:sialic acid synthase SpsE